MTGPAGGSRSLDTSTTILVGVLGVALVAGFVVLSALGRDTTSYLLFLGGPAVTGLVGALLNRRVAGVTDAVETRAAETKAVVEQNVSDLDNHLTAQDEVIAAAAVDARAARVAVSGTTDSVPGPRPAETSPFGPVRSGLTPLFRED